MDEAVKQALLVTSGEGKGDKKWQILAYQISEIIQFGDPCRTNSFVSICN